MNHTVSSSFPWTSTKSLDRCEAVALSVKINPLIKNNFQTKTASSSPSSPRRIKVLFRNRQNINNISPLHVAAIFSSAARQLSFLNESTLLSSNNINR